METQATLKGKKRNECFKIIEGLQHQIEEKKLEIKEKDAAIAARDETIESLHYRLQLALRHRYAARREKLESGAVQLDLFDKVEIPEQAAEAKKDKPHEKVSVKGHQRKKGGRKTLPDDLPRVRREHDLSDEEKRCKCGCALHAIGEDVSEQLEIIPAQMYVIEHVKKKYACKACESNVKIAKGPRQAIPKSLAGPGLLSHILVSKFCDYLPLYRQETILKRCGVEISRSNLCYWVVRCGEHFEPLIDLLRTPIIDYDTSFADETTLQVLKEKNRAPHQKSYVWLFGGGPPEKFAWIYQYHPGREAAIATAFFEGFKGFVHVDGYAGYNALETKGVTLVGCMAHVRRKFFNVAKVAKKKGLGYWAVNHIKKLYAIEREAKEKALPPEKIKALRDEKARPLMEEFKAWLETNSRRVPPKSAIADAIQYATNQWKKLEVYLMDGRLEIDNNRTERAIRPFVMGRSNFLFANSPQGAKAIANIYTLIETCKAHNIEPYAYLRHLLVHLPQTTTREEKEALLPYNCDREKIEAEWLSEKQRITLTEPETSESSIA